MSAYKLKSMGEFRDAVEGAFEARKCWLTEASNKSENGFPLVCSRERKGNCAW